MEYQTQGASIAPKVETVTDIIDQLRKQAAMLEQDARTFADNITGSQPEKAQGPEGIPNEQTVISSLRDLRRTLNTAADHLQRGRYALGCAK